MKKSTREQVKNFVRALRANTDRYLDDEITHEEFSATQRATWDKVAKAGAEVSREVTRAIRLNLGVEEL